MGRIFDRLAADSLYMGHEFSGIMQHVLAQEFRCSETAIEKDIRRINLAGAEHGIQIENRNRYRRGWAACYRLSAGTIEMLRQRKP